MKAEYPKIGGLKVELEKRIPVGAGLGGGSSDAARTLLFINTYYNLDLSKRRLRQLGALLGADVPFFIDNKPMLAYGIGDELQETDFVLPYSIKLVTPDVFSSTAEAYRSLDLAQCHRDSRLEELLKEPIHEWKNCIFNDFEPSVFRKFPQLAEAKQKLYDEGALYASMTGSGSALFGIFDSADGRNSL
jgi:4-diphosphocytidyl-2-C-methyl-D-erythritol kinase